MASKIDRILDKVIESGEKIAAIEQHLKNQNDKILRQEKENKECKEWTEFHYEKAMKKIDIMESDHDKFKGSIRTLSWIMAGIAAVSSIIATLKMMSLI